MVLLYNLACCKMDLKVQGLFLSLARAFKFPVSHQNMCPIHQSVQEALEVRLISSVSEKKQP